jgi:hypothetical protein
MDGMLKDERNIISDGRSAADAGAKRRINLNRRRAAKFGAAVQQALRVAHNALSDVAIRSGTLTGFTHRR